MHFYTKNFDISLIQPNKVSLGRFTYLGVLKENEPLTNAPGVPKNELIVEIKEPNKGEALVTMGLSDVLYFTSKAEMSGFFNVFRFHFVSKESL